MDQMELDELAVVCQKMGDVPGFRGLADPGGGSQPPAA